MDAQGKRRWGMGDASSRRVEDATKELTAVCMLALTGAGGLWKLDW